MNKKIIVSSIVIVGILALGFSYLYLKNQEKLANQSLQEINVKLKFFHQAQFAGFYVAEQRGFYKHEGLKVNLIPYIDGEGTDVEFEQVLSGAATFGVEGADQVLIKRSNGQPVKAIAAIYQQSPIGAFVLKESGIREPADFIGKVVGLEPAADIDMLYNLLLDRLLLDRKQITEKTIGWDASELLQKKVDVATGYLVNEPYNVIKAGKEVVTIPFSDYLEPIYADVIFTSDDIIRTKPELVEKFLRSTLKGWNYAFDNEHEATDIVLQYAASSSFGQQSYMLKNSKPLIVIGVLPIGSMNKAKWQTLKDILVQYKRLTNPVNIEDVFTLEFLNKISALP